MEKFAGAVLRHKRAVTLAFLAIMAVCAVLLFGVRVNYNMADYLPASAQSTKAVELMAEEFTQAVPNASVMVRDVSIPEALDCKARLAAIDGVTEVLWLDDMADVYQPLEMTGAGTVEGFYKDGNALFSVTIAEGMESEAVEAIRALIGEGNAVSGDAADADALQNATGAEVTNAVVILVPAILAILLLSTTSWIEPLFFLAAIGASIVINMGTNAFLGEVSYVTNSVSPILQLAVSLDYAIFLLHSFADFRKETDDVTLAMAKAMKRSMPAVAASAMTTLFGFLALAFMQFGIGADLGLNLAKGIVLSYVSCTVFLPAFTLWAYKLIDKTRHRPLMPSFAGIGKVLGKIAVPVLIFVVVISVPAFLGQANTAFTYGNADAGSGSRAARETEAVKEVFGQSTVMAILVPRGEPAREYELGKALESIPHVTGVVSYASTVGSAIPAGFLGTDVTGQFYSQHYARIIAYTDTPQEGDLAFAVVEDLDAAVAEYYPEGAYTAGQAANLYDMKSVVTQDNSRVNLIAVLSIFAVLLFTFRSATLPFLLLFTIEAGIWINLAIPYFTGAPINFLGYLVVNTVQLGATVDYAILLTSYHMENRRLLPKRAALNLSLGQSFKSILVSASTLTIAGFTLAGTSSNPAVAVIGSLLGRGTILSFLLVTCMLPALLTLCDKLIAATTWKPRFFSGNKA